MLPAETVGYILEVSKALAINDEVAAIRAFRSIQKIIDQNQMNESSPESAEDSKEEVSKLEDDIAEILPEPTPSMK